jgi:uncharacterized membrane protein
LSTSRLEAFSDGVFAIAATLLILNVAVNEGSPLDHELVRIWPSYAAYAVAFLTIGVVWANHHMVIDQCGKVNRLFLMLNVMFLMLVAFFPFPTRLLAENITSGGARAAAIAYGVTGTLTAIMYNILWFYAARGRRLLRDDVDPRVVEGISRSYLPGPLIYLAATLVALLNPQVGALIFALVPVFYVLESSVFSRAG